MGDVIQLRAVQDARLRKERYRQIAAYQASVLPMLVAPLAITIACTALFTALFLRRW